MSGGSNDAAQHARPDATQLTQTAGTNRLQGSGWCVERLAVPPLIAPARQYTFPFAVPGEEDALARGALLLNVRVEHGGAWLAQCALGFSVGNEGGVAHGLWPLPDERQFLAVAGGYAYVIAPDSPEATELLPPRPAVAVLALPARTVLLTHHGLLVREQDGELWSTPRLSWEGLSLTAMEGDTLHGLGWDLMDDVEVPFSVDLLRRTAQGGGFRPG